MPKNKQLEDQDYKILYSASDIEIHDLINRAFNVFSLQFLKVITVAIIY